MDAPRTFPQEKKRLAGFRQLGFFRIKDRSADYSAIPGFQTLEKQLAHWRDSCTSEGQVRPPSTVVAVQCCSNTVLRAVSAEFGIRRPMMGSDGAIALRF